MDKTYLILNIFTIGFPFLLSFDKKVAFFKRWRSLFPGILFAGTIFIIWDIWFTANGVWSFNPDYLVGIEFAGLPLEEYLFFLTVPYACVFIYDCLKAYISKDLFQPYAQRISYVLMGVLGLVAILALPRAYTCITFGLTVLWLFMIHKWSPSDFMGRFYMAYLVHLIPFFIINGVLTSFPVVIYNNAENLSFRLGTIPVEDTIYSMLLLLMVISVYEFLENKVFSTAHQERSYA